MIRNFITMADSNNGWGEYQKLVLTELKRLNTLVTKIEDQIIQLKVTTAVMGVKQKAQMAFFGALGGAIPAAVILFLKLSASS